MPTADQSWVGAPGIHLVDPVSASDSASLAGSWREDGWQVVDMVGGQDLTDVLRGFGTALSFPDWYGVNLDALEDCLADVTGATVVLWSGWQGFHRDHPRDWEKLLAVLGRRVDDEGLDEFAVLLV